jgi:hemoglobin
MKLKMASAALALLVSAGTLRAQAPASQSPSLYKRLGGYDAIAAVTDEFIARFAADKSLSRFLVGLSDNSKARLRQLVVDQICAGTGGPCVYTGRDTRTAHKGLGITEADWSSSVKILTDALDKFHVPAKEKDEFLAVVSSLKKDIVEKP